MATRERLKYTVAWKDPGTGKVRRRKMSAAVRPDGWLVLKAPKGCVAANGEDITVQIDLPKEEHEG